MTGILDRAGRALGPVHMGWRHVLFANWAVDPDAVRPHVPDATTLDTYGGEAWLSVVPFTNVDVRPTWFPSGWGFRLPELNLRTYVTVDGEAGVYFFNLDADGVLGVVGARLFHHLPYFYARMELDAGGAGEELDSRAEEVRFSSRRRHPGARPADFAATYGPEGEAFESEPGSLEAFLTERHRYYTESPAGDLRYARVRHERWPLHRAWAAIGENGLFEANGFDDPAGEPLLLYSPGVDTVASESRRP